MIVTKIKEKNSPVNGDLTLIAGYLPGETWCQSINAKKQLARAMIFRRPSHFLLFAAR